MEKIYMENNNKNKNNNLGEFFKEKGVVIVSVLIAVVAIGAFITASFNGVSYALPEVQNVLPDTFESGVGEGRMVGNGSGISARITVEPYYAKTSSGNVSVFCLERNVDFKPGVNYTKGEAISDYGLLYLMANAYPNKNFTGSDGKALVDKVQIWITQMAIWDYLYQTGADNNSKYSEIVDDVKKVHQIYDAENYSDLTNGLYEGDLLYSKYIEPLVSEAIKNRSVPNKNLSINKASNDISLTEDGKYYQSSLITITGAPSDNFNGFNIDFNSAPEGSVIINEEGKEVKSDDDLRSGTKVYVRVPVDKLKEDNRTVEIRVTGSFTTYEGNYYTGKNTDGTNAQTVTSVQTVNSNISKGLDIEFDYTPDVPDTGMSTAQTIYFIGLIVLVSGVGIIYANVKPKENN